MINFDEVQNSEASTRCGRCRDGLTIMFTISLTIDSSSEAEQRMPVYEMLAQHYSQHVPGKDAIGWFGLLMPRLYTASPADPAGGF